MNAQSLKHLFHADPCFLFRNWVVALCILIQTVRRYPGVISRQAASFLRDAKNSMLVESTFISEEFLPLPFGCIEPVVFVLYKFLDARVLLLNLNSRFYITLYVSTLNLGVERKNYFNNFSSTSVHFIGCHCVRDPLSYRKQSDKRRDISEIKRREYKHVKGCRDISVPL